MMLHFGRKEGWEGSEQPCTRNIRQKQSDNNFYCVDFGIEEVQLERNYVNDVLTEANTQR